MKTVRLTHVFIITLTLISTTWAAQTDSVPSSASSACELSWSVLDTAVGALVAQNHMAEALTVAEKARIAAEKEFGKDSLQYATALYHLGIVHMVRHEMTKAESRMKEALDTLKKVAGAQDTDRIDIL